MDSISSTNTWRSLPLSDLMRATVSGAIAVPVEDYSPFISFKHLTGVPADGNGGISVTRLQMIDNMIDHLMHLKNASAAADIPTDATNLSPAAIDQAIASLTKRLSTAAATGLEPIQPRLAESFGMAQSNQGALVSLLA